MIKLISKYKQFTFEQKTIYKTTIGLCFSVALAGSKLVVGLFMDFNLVCIAIYTFAMLVSKLECILGIKSNKRTFQQRNALIAVSLFLSCIIYIGFMCQMFFIERKIQSNSLQYVLPLALFSFLELGFSIAGLVRTKGKRHYYRNIRIINFCVALIAILTTQMSILNMTSTTGVVHIANAYTGIGVGVFIALCAIHIFLAPKTSIIERKHNVFMLEDSAKNALVDMCADSVQICLSSSNLHGSYIYRAEVTDGIIDGEIVCSNSLWKRMNIFWKIICCLLSEILVFVWLISRFLYYLRSMNLPRRLERKMIRNGYVKIDLKAQ